MEVKNLNCPNCGSPVQVSNNQVPFNCKHCGSALVFREEAGISFLELGNKLTSIIEGGNQEIISAIQKTSRESADTRLYQSQIEQELTAINVQLVPLKSEFSTLRSAKKDPNVTRRLSLVSIQIYMLLERMRMLQAKLQELKDPQSPPLERLYQQYMSIQSEFGYLSCAGEASDVRQYKANLTSQHNELEKHMVEIISADLGSVSLTGPLENDVQHLSNKLKVIQGDIRKVSSLAATGATHKVLANLRIKEKEVNNLIGRINSEARRAENKRQLAAKLTDITGQRNEILKQRKLTNRENITFLYREQSIRRPGLMLFVVLIFLCSCSFASTTLFSTTAGKTPANSSDVSALQTVAVKTALVHINQTATKLAHKNTPSLTPANTATATLISIEGVIIQDSANLRASPTLDAPSLAKLAVSTKIFAVGTSTDKAWFLVTSDDGKTGWIHNSVVEISGSPEDLTISTEVLITPSP